MLRCIRNSVDAGHISLGDGQQLQKKIDDLLRAGLGPRQARERVADELEKEALQKKRVTLLTEERRQALERDLFAHRDAKGRADLAGAFMALHEHMGTARFDDIEGKRLAITADAHARMEGLLYEFRKGAISGDLRRGQADVVARMDNVVREAFGADSGDAKAKALAGAWSDVAEDLRQRFNAGGGAIGKLEKWGLPQAHDREKILAAGRASWVDGLMQPGVLDRDRMTHPLTGQPRTDGELREALDYAYDTITTDGWAHREPSATPTGRGALFKQHADHRFLVFKDADQWLAYQKAFGEGDAFAGMMGHINTMARDIAAMEVLGPNPDAMRTYLRQVIQKQAAERGENVDYALFRADEVWATYRGTAQTPVNITAANTMSAIRNVITSAVLGTASVTSISDVGTQIVRRKFNGLPATKVFNDVVRQFSPENRREAVRAGLILDSAVHVLDTQARYVGALTGPNWSRFLSDRVLTYSGLSPFTQAGKHAFGMELMAAMGERAGQAFDRLDGPFRRMLERHGFDAAGWDAIRAAPRYGARHGAELLRASEIRDAVGRELSERYTAMILRETREAIPEGFLRSQSLFTGSSRPGTLVGEIVRSGMQFKSFPIAFVMLHGATIHRELAAGRYASGAIYAGSLLITMTFFGALSMQLKEIVNGRDPRNMTALDKKGPEFWGAAMLQGGGLGIYGDFLFADVNRYGGGLARTVAGPIWDRASDVRNLTIGNLLQSAEGEKTNFGREAVKTLKTNTPGASIWYARLAWERVLFDQMQWMADPEAHSAFRRRQQQRRKEYGNESWWRPGDLGPVRGPDLGAAVGGR